MSLLQRSAVVTAMLAALSVPVLAQTNTPTTTTTAQSADAPTQRHSRGDHHQHEARMQQRLQTLKTALKITANQESAWSTYTAAIQPQRPANGERPEHPDRKAFAAMTTPERIDAMQAMQQKRQAQMESRNQATKAFYAALTPEQQKTFDTETLKMHERHGRHKGEAH